MIKTIALLVIITALLAFTTPARADCTQQSCPDNICVPQACAALGGTCNGTACVFPPPAQCPGPVTAVVTRATPFTQATIFYWRVSPLKLVGVQGLAPPSATTSYSLPQVPTGTYDATYGCTPFAICWLVANAPKLVETTDTPDGVQLLLNDANVAGPTFTMPFTWPDTGAQGTMLCAVAAGA